MHLEIVSHCWNYSRLLTYQLSSLVLHPPRDLSVTMTVFYNQADERTINVLDYFADIRVRNVSWRRWHLEQPQLFRRAIGRNLAALANTADWVWFNDCDQVFHRGLLDALAHRLPQCTEPLAFPTTAGCTELVRQDDPILARVEAGPTVVDIEVERFAPRVHNRAIGALQIARGDVLREMGYCKDIKRFMRPAKQFGRTREDVKFRRLLGTRGEALDVPGLYRIEHLVKGRRRWFHFSRSL